LVKREWQLATDAKLGEGFRRINRPIPTPTPLWPSGQYPNARGAGGGKRSSCLLSFAPSFLRALPAKGGAFCCAVRSQLSGLSALPVILHPEDYARWINTD
jgi:hypothetical protein